ncbi:hypothetical protein [Salinicoccus halodurans]|uniref:Uncharacterized protein n=1 Tax=Salinicoccus halodurans TaxID=407035 RepID=A0A0F7HPN4_9STAP|nr:hypothetical protein [Salinicoccus halodurans]AKG75179.1 hypothetical protein AAT16_13900 [Salinicoccus halodurans]SFK73234.1 hypothetical protein SAMN05216235_1353 [Salinicoccus halodurans]
MGLFDFFKKNDKQGETAPAEKYWLLADGDGKVMEPDWAQIEKAVKTAVSGPAGEFIHLGYMNSGLEIESLQAVGEDGVYRVEALPSKGSYDYGRIYINDGVRYEDTLALFKEFHEHQRVVGFRSWDMRKL